MEDGNLALIAAEERGSLTGSSPGPQLKRCVSSSAVNATVLKKVKIHDTACRSAPSQNTTNDGLALKSNDIVPTQGIVNVYRKLLFEGCAVQDDPARCPGIATTSQAGFKAVFHSSDRCGAEHCCLPFLRQERTTLSLQSAIQKPVNDVISVDDQLILARRLTSGFLQYYNTSWLSNIWSSEDLSVFSSNGEISEPVLRTLHYEKHLLPSIASPSSIAGADENLGNLSNVKASTNSKEDPDRAVRAEGFPNIALYELGRFLLQIGYWKPLENLHPAEVRKLLSAPGRRPPICKRYRDIARKCLECDFGAGQDLSAHKLQKAVFKDVVCELEQLISQLDIQDTGG